jgi:hypothetical protein
MASDFPYTPAALSPLSRAPERCALPYGLTDDDLRPSLNDAGAQPIIAFASHDKQGLNGGPNSCILTLQYTTKAGAAATQIVFIKQSTRPDSFEAERYGLLQRHGVPTPRLLATTRRPNEEIIVTEFLPTIGIEFGRMNEVEELLRLVAHLNAIPVNVTEPPRQPAAAPNEYDQKLSRTIQAVVTAYWPGADANKLFASYLSAQSRMHGLPTAYNHCEFYYQQVGWSVNGGVRQLVVFDLATLIVCARFTDIGGVLPSLAVQTVLPEEKLFDIYLKAYCAKSGTTLDSAQSFQEMRLVRLVHYFWSLNWELRRRKAEGRESEWRGELAWLQEQFATMGLD